MSGGKQEHLRFHIKRVLRYWLGVSIVLQVTILVLLGILYFREARADNVIPEGEPYQPSVVIDGNGLLSPIQETTVHARFADNNETYNPSLPPKPVVIYPVIDYSLSLHERAKKLVGTYGGWCVQFAKEFLGKSGTWGDAWEILPNISVAEAQVGDVILIGDLHVGVVTQIYFDTNGVLTFSYVDANGRGSARLMIDGIVRMQDIKLIDLNLRGFSRI